MTDCRMRRPLQVRIMLTADVWRQRLAASAKKRGM